MTGLHRCRASASVTSALGSFLASCSNRTPHAVSAARSPSMPCPETRQHAASTERLSSNCAWRHVPSPPCVTSCACDVMRASSSGRAVVSWRRNACVTCMLLSRVRVRTVKHRRRQALTGIRCTGCCRQILHGLRNGATLTAQGSITATTISNVGLNTVGGPHD